MLTLAARTNVRLGALRAAIESTLGATGILLGARAGAGTALFALAIGPAIEITMTILSRSPLTAEHPDAPPHLPLSLHHNSPALRRTRKRRG